jgi:MFS family permease
MIAKGPYAQLLALPQVRQLVISSVVGRIPVGLTTLALVLFLQSRMGSLADAGLAAACYVLGLALTAPVIGRAVDRAGPRRVLLACTAVYPTALVILTSIVLMAAHRRWVFAAALAAGASLPPITVCARALYPRLVREVSLQRVAYSLDSAIIEAVFIVGPALAAGFAALGIPAGAVLLAAACAVAGGILFLRAEPVRAWQPRGHSVAARTISPLRDPRLRGLIAAALLFATAFGLFEIGVVGFATAQGAPAAGGVLLALASVGSVLGVLVYGGRSWRLDVGRQFLVLLALMTVGLAMLAPIDSLPLFALVVVVAAAPMAPVIAANSVLVSRVAAEDRVAEAFTWASTALLAGISAGTAVGGMLVERYSPPFALLAAAGAALTAALVAYPVVRRDA